MWHWGSRTAKEHTGVGRSLAQDEGDRDKEMDVLEAELRSIDTVGAMSLSEARWRL